MNLDEARDAIGRRVIYRDPHRDPEVGVISSVNERVVFVRYGLGDTAAGTPPERLELEVGGPPRSVTRVADPFRAPAAAEPPAPARPGAFCPGCSSEMWPPIRHGVTAEGLPCHDPWHYPRPAGELVTVTGRRVRREEHVDLVVIGVPEMQFRPPGGGARLSAVPTSARVNYRFVQGFGREPDRWETAADVWCPGGYRQLVVDGDDHNVEHWPAWLVHHAEANHPDRPGGWPGDDPEGSYL